MGLTPILLSAASTAAACYTCFVYRRAIQKALLSTRATIVASANTPPLYIAPSSGETFPLDTPRWSAGEHPDGSPVSLMLTPLPGITREQINRAERSLWRYAAAFPMACADPISLGEGCTPLVPRPFAGGKPLFKLEWNNPTCSFKDRGTSVMLSLLRQQGITHVLEDSSGNGGASVELIPGSRQACADAAVAAHGRDEGRLFYASHNWHPFFLQGTKTLAYELWEDLGFNTPDNIIIPTGAGSNILGLDLGFTELINQGEVSRRPKLFCAQPLLCSPIATGILDALGVKDGRAAPVSGWNTPGKTMAEGTSIAKPVRLRECVDAVVRSNGGAVRVNEAEITDATLQLAKVGLYTEPTCAQAAAAYKLLLEGGGIKKEETTVIVLTSTGVKATPAFQQLLA